MPQIRIRRATLGFWMNGSAESVEGVQFVSNSLADLYMPEDINVQWTTLKISAGGWYTSPSLGINKNTFSPLTNTRSNCF